MFQKYTLAFAKIYVIMRHFVLWQSRRFNPLWVKFENGAINQCTTEPFANQQHYQNRYGIVIPKYMGSGSNIAHDAWVSGISMGINNSNSWQPSL